MEQTEDDAYFMTSEKRMMQAPVGKHTDSELKRGLSNLSYNKMEGARGESAKTAGRTSPISQQDKSLFRSSINE